MEFKIPLSAEELILAADCASMVQNHAALVSQDAPRWLDAPTCEGWWWKKTQYNMEVVFIQHLKGGLWMLIHGEPWRLPSAARWFGPLVPPSAVSGATSSGASVV